MKILHVITTIERGGAENQLLSLVKGQKSQNHEVQVLFLKNKPELMMSFKDLGIDCRKFSFMTIGKDPITYWKFLRKFDVLHGHLPRAEILCFFASLITGRPFIVTRHNAEKFFPKAPHWISSAISRSVTRKCSVVIAISNYVKIYLVDSGEVIPSEKISVIYYGYQQNRERKRRDIEHNSKSSSKLNFLTIGRLAPQKNLSFLIKLIAKMNEELDCSLSILGEGYLEGELRALVSSLKLNSKIHFLGKVSDVDEHLKRCDLFLFASKYEGFGLVLLEAMEARAKIVASDIGVIREVLGEKYLFLADPNDVEDFIVEIKRALKQDLAYFELTYSERLQFFNIEKCVVEHMRVYDRAKAISMGRN